ncbi:MAG: hypothetical protein QXS21_03100 [Thermoproteota archaeon]|nr:hypothetical protein [Candidatus Brockarchaeota archaeon]MBO3801722.1 hypothetical protein [Candidatus Brockarchaeota archaeon]
MSNEKVVESQTKKAEEKPMLAFALVLAGFIVQSLIFAFRIFRSSIFIMVHRRIVSLIGLPMYPLIWVFVATIVLGLELVGVILIYSSDINKVRIGSTIVLVTSLLAYPTLWGFFVGSILSIIGSILGLLWKS